MSKLLTVLEVSERLQVPVGTIRYWVHVRRIPHVKLGGHLRFEESAIEGWIESSTVGAALPPVKVIA